VLANDVDPAAGGLTLTLAAIETEIPAGAGSVAIVGNQVRYTPAPLYTGAVLVRYTATDINGNTTQGQLSLTVTL
jgi:large repetitive protein